MTRTHAIKLGRTRGRARVYLQGRWLVKAGFQVGAALAVTFGQGRVVLALGGDRTVSGKSDVPVIDVTGAQLEQALSGASDLVVRARNGQLVITPSRTAAKLASRCRNGKEGAIFAGAGLLSEAARQAGYAPAWAIEWDERYADAYERNHPGAVMHCQSVSEVAVADLSPVELLTIGVPCEPFSTKRQKGGQVPEAHELGDMTAWALILVDAVNPATVVVENVPGYLTSGAGMIMQHALRRMGYQVEARVIDPADHGQLAGRRRAVILATSGAAPRFQAPSDSVARLGDVLDPDAGEWFDRTSKPWVFAHWDRQRAKGNGFTEGRVLTADTTRVPCLSKRYLNGQGDGVVVAHPTKPDTYRWLTLGEIRTLHGVPEHYQLPGAKTVAGEVLGQAVVVPVWRDLILAQRG